MVHFRLDTQLGIVWLDMVEALPLNGPVGPVRLLIG